MSWRLDDSDLQKLSQLNEREVKHLWHMDFYDGPLTGVAECRGQQCWFQFASEDEAGRHYRYVLYPLSEEHGAQLQRWYEAREAWRTKYLGWKDEDGRQVATKAWEAAGLDWNGPDLTGVTPLGWFMDGANEDFYAIKVVKREETTVSQ